MKNRENDLLEALIGTSKSAASLLPVVGQAIAGYDAYKKSIFDRNLKMVLENLNEKVDGVIALFSSDWLKTEEGKLFTSKVLDAALDAQLEDKQELFVNALINGINKDNIEFLEKLKFVDLLRSLSKASLMVLADVYELCKHKVRRESGSHDPIEAFPLINSETLSKELSNKYHPYLVNAAIKEMEGQGLFSNIGVWNKGFDGKYVSGGGFEKELCFTDFTARFIDFILIEKR